MHRVSDSGYSLLPSASSTQSDHDDYMGADLALALKTGSSLGLHRDSTLRHILRTAYVPRWSRRSRSPQRSHPGWHAAVSVDNEVNMPQSDGPLYIFYAQTTGNDARKCFPYPTFGAETILGRTPSLDGPYRVFYAPIELQLSIDLLIVQVSIPAFQVIEMVFD